MNIVREVQTSEQDVAITISVLESVLNAIKNGENYINTTCEDMNPLNAKTQSKWKDVDLLSNAIKIVKRVHDLEDTDS